MNAINKLAGFYAVMTAVVVAIFIYQSIVHHIPVTFNNDFDFAY